jgi:hypothetical protein
MNWQSIDSQTDLDSFAKSVCWEDSSTFAYFATEENRDGYPSDVSRSGFTRKNLHIFCSADSSKGKFLEMAFIHADSFTSDFLDQPFVGGRVDSLRRVELTDAKGRTLLRCGRMIFRFRAEQPCIAIEVLPKIE